MDKKLLDALDTLDVKEASFLLKDENSFNINNRTKKRIINSTKEKINSYTTKTTYKNNNKSFLGGIFMKRKLAIGLALTVLFTVTGGVFSYSRKAVAYVSLDINPSVELGVSPFNKVVSYEAYNEDGEKILEGNENLNVDVTEAVDKLVDSAIKNDYIKDDGSSAISITAVTDDTKLADKLNTSLENEVNKVLDENNSSAEVETSNVALERRAMAKELGITPGKLNLIQKMQSLDPSINIEDYKNASVKEIQKHTKELKKNAKAKIDDSNNATSDENSVETPAQDTVVPTTSGDQTKKEKSDDAVSNEEKKNVAPKVENNNSNKDVEKNKSEEKTSNENKDKVTPQPKNEDKAKSSNSENGNAEKNNKNKNK